MQEYFENLNTARRWHEPAPIGDLAPATPSGQTTTEAGAGQKPYSQGEGEHRLAMRTPAGKSSTNRRLYSRHGITRSGGMKVSGEEFDLRRKDSVDVNSYSWRDWQVIKQLKWCLGKGHPLKSPTFTFSGSVRTYRVTTLNEWIRKGLQPHHLNLLWRSDEAPLTRSKRFREHTHMNNFWLTTLGIYDIKSALYEELENALISLTAMAENKLTSFNHSITWDDSISSLCEQSATICELTRLIKTIAKELKRREAGQWIGLNLLCSLSRSITPTNSAEC